MAEDLKDDQKIDVAARGCRLVFTADTHSRIINEAYFKRGVAWRDENPKEHDCPNHHLYPVEQCVVCPAEQSGYHRAIKDVCEWINSSDGRQRFDYQAAGAFAQSIQSKFKGDV